MTTYCLPNPQDDVWRFVQSLQQESADHYIDCGERHFDDLVREQVEHYYTERPHQGLGNVPVMRDPTKLHGDPPSEIVSRRRLGGLLNHYVRAA